MEYASISSCINPGRAKSTRYEKTYCRDMNNIDLVGVRNTNSDMALI
jgi:hypothetical protein